MLCSIEVCRVFAQKSFALLQELCSAIMDYGGRRLRE